MVHCGAWEGAIQICEIDLMIHPKVSFDANVNICFAILIEFPVNFPVKFDFLQTLVMITYITKKIKLN